MSKFERVEDKWKHLRKDLYGNVEPDVRLEAITMPVEKWLLPSFGHFTKSTSTYSDGSIDWKKIEQLPALSAGVSYGSKKKLENDTERTIKLNKKLIELKHLTPLEAIQYNIHISGISKACGAQLSRYRHTGHISASLRYQESQPLFVYPMLDYIEFEDAVKDKLNSISRMNENSFNSYQYLRSDKINIRGTGCTPEQYDYCKQLSVPLHKEDARGVLPVSYATERIMWVNARELRHIFSERLKSDAQWEIRRLCWVIYDLVVGLTPSLFEDIVNDL